MIPACPTTPSQPDAQLVAQARAGQSFAYETLVRRWSPRVLAVCHARVANAAAAEDLAQETLLRAMRSLQSLADPEKFGPWIAGIANRTCLDWLKKSERTEVSLGQRDFSKPQTDTLESQEQIQSLMQAVENLPPALKETLMLYYHENCTYADLAQRLSVSSATINARLTQARAILREKLSPKPVTNQQR